MDAELLQIAFKRHTVDVFELFAHVGHTALQLLTDRGKRDVFRIGAVDVFADLVNGRIALRNGVETDGVPERRGDDLNGVTAQHDVRAEGLASELVERIAEEALHPPIFIVKNGVHRRFPRQGVRWNDPAVEHDVVEKTFHGERRVDQRREKQKVDHTEILRYVVEAVGAVALENHVVADRQRVPLVLPLFIRCVAEPEMT